MRTNFELNRFETADELVNVAAGQAMSMISERLAEGLSFHMALTGGDLGNKFAEKFIDVVNNAGNLPGLHIWLSDERFDSSGSELLNSRPITHGLKNPSVTLHQVQSSDGGASVYQAAAAYDAELSSITMDICVLGLGPDGHVASLFPMLWDSKEVRAAIAVDNSPKPPAERVSFSMAFINASDQVWIMASGDVRSNAVQWVLAADPSFPAGHVQGARTTRLFVDADALPAT